VLLLRALEIETVRSSTQNASHIFKSVVKFWFLVNSVLTLILLTWIIWWVLNNINGDSNVKLRRKTGILKHFGTHVSETKHEVFEEHGDKRISHGNVWHLHWLWNWIQARNDTPIYVLYHTMKITNFTLKYHRAFSDYSTFSEADLITS